MFKRIITVVIVILLLFFASFSLHNYFNTAILEYSLLSVYAFHAIAVILVYAVVEFVSDKLPNQAGYAYLMLMFFKIGSFTLIFQTSVFAKVSLSQPEKLGLVVPLFLFLIAEAIVVGKLLNNK